MKIAVLLGSPHENGSSNMIANEFVRGAKEAGNEVGILDVAHFKMNLCLGCEHCGMNGDCVYSKKDDNEKIRDMLLSSDMAVFVTPIYYFGISAQLKMAIDRFYSYTTRLSSKGLKTVLIAAAWNSDYETMKPTVVHYEALCDYMHFEDCGRILGSGCGSPAMTKSSKYLKEAYNLGKTIK